MDFGSFIQDLSNEMKDEDCSKAELWLAVVVDALTASKPDERAEKISIISRILDSRPVTHEGEGIIRAFKTQPVHELYSLLSMPPMLQLEDSAGATILHYLAANNSPGVIDIIMRLVKQLGMDPRQCDGQGYTPLHIAVSYGNIEVAKALVGLGVGVNKRTIQGCTALWFACFTNNTECATFLLEKKAKIQGWTEETCLHVAACAGNLELCKLLVEKGAPINVVDSQGATPLIGASENGQANVVAYLLSRKANIFHRDELGCSAFLKASMEGHVECVRLLLQNGACACEAPPSGSIQMHALKGHPVKTGISFACIHGNMEVLELLLAAGVGPEGVHAQEFPLMHASFMGHVDICKRLVEAGADVNRAGTVGEYGGRTPLMMAIENCQLNVASYLLKKGANVNYQGSRGNALTKAVITKKNEVVQFILDNGGKPARGEAHPLYVAVLTGDINMAKFLLKKGISVKDVKWPLQPLTKACELGNFDIACLLLENGASPDPSSFASESPLSYAAKAGHMKLLTKLIDAGAKVDGATGSGLPLAMAAQEGHLDAVKFLVQKGAKLNAPTPALCYSVGKRHDEVTFYLLEAGYNPNCTKKGANPLLPLWVAATEGSVKVVEALLAKGADPNGRRYFPPVVPAAYSGQPEILKMLINAGADVNAHAGKDGLAGALMGAIGGNHYDCVKILLEHNAETLAPKTDDDPPTPLDGAFHTASEEIVLLLLRANAKATGDAPPMCLAARRSVNMVKALEKEGYSFDVKDGVGATPLHYAAMSEGCSDIIRYLVEKGCDIEALSKYQASPLYYAVDEQDVDLISTLIDLGADPASLRDDLEIDSNETPSSICMQNEEINKLISQARSPEGVARRKSVLSKRRKVRAKRVTRSSSAAEPMEAAEIEMPPPPTPPLFTFDAVDQASADVPSPLGLMGGWPSGLESPTGYPSFIFR